MVLLAVIIALARVVRRQHLPSAPPGQLPAERDDSIATLPLVRRKGIARARALAAQLSNSSLPLPEERYPRTFLNGWAARTLVISRENRVAYLMIPKSGSSSIRAVLIRDFRVKPNLRQPNRLGGILDKFRLPVRSAMDVRQLRDVYVFTFIVDPVSHFVAGICEVNKNKCHEATVQGRVGAKLAHNFNRRGLHIAAAMKGNHSGDLDQHLTPQSFLLRAAGAAGIPLSFVAPLSKVAWKDLRADMAARGYPAPGPLPHKHARSFSKLKYSIFQALPRATRDAVCEYLAEEYVVLRLEMAADNVCRASQ